MESRVMTTTAVWFETIDRPAGKRKPLSPRTWTCIGALAIPLWATWPALALRTFEIPTLQMLTIMFAVGWMVLSRLERRDGAAPAASSIRAWVPAIAFALNLCGSDLCFILATHRIPAAQANLIAYLWPVMIVVFGVPIGLFRLRWPQMIGLSLGFLGAVILIWDGQLTMSPVGIGLALLGGAVWAAYCLFRLVWKEPTRNVVGRGCGIAAAISAILHFVFEPTVIPGASALVSAAVIGILPLAVGNLVWDEGFRRGDRQLLAVMAYATPLCSALLLAALGVGALSWNLLVGGAVIAIAGILSRTD
jgi:drug/metabolite transporter (DMT)-like permease